MSHMTEQTVTRRGEAAPARLGSTGRTALSMAVAGGVLVGGVLLATLAASGRMRSSHLLVIGTVLYLVGAILGFLHGAVLGYLGREQGVSPREAFRRLGWAAAYAPLPLAAGWAVSGWIATTAGNVLYGNPWLLVGTGFGLSAGVFTVGVAARCAWASLCAAYARWPERVLGTVVVASAYGILALAFLGMPAAAFGGLVPTALGAVLAAGALTAWVVGPLATMTLRNRGR